MSSLGQKKKRVIQRKNSTSAKKIVLERVIGNTVGHNSSFSCNPSNGDIAYPTGCLVVIYNPKRNKQVKFLANKENKVISFVCYSGNGKYIAIGESGHRPAVAVWDTTTWQIVSELRGHKFGISCGAFSPNLKYLVTVGLQHDGHLYLWDWRAQQTLAFNKTTTDIYSVAFSEDGTHFVTAGLRHLKFWYLDPSGNFKVADKATRTGNTGVPNQIQLIEGRSGVLGAYRDAAFVDVTCGRNATSGYTYCVTSTGMLCAFGPSRLMEKWVNLKASRVFSLSVSEGMVACACADGVIRLFEHLSLEYISTLPRPSPLGKSNAVPGETALSPNDVYPDAVAVRLSSDGRIAAIYSDRSFIMWDIRNTKKIGLSRSFLSHCACIWDIAICPDAGPFPEGSFVTCSADNTIRIWNLDATSSGLNTSMSVEDMRASIAPNVYSKELLHTIYVGNDYSIFKARDAAESRTGSTVVGEGGIRCVSIRPDGHQIASGDRQGNLRVYSTDTYSCVEFKEAHDAEILALDFSPAAEGKANEAKKFLLGTASRDRLVHIFDSAKGYDLVSTLDDHSSSITAVKFACNGSKLLTCSADKSIIFRNISYDESSPIPSIKRYHQATVPYGTLYDLDVDATQKYAVVVGQDKRLSIYNILDGKVKRTYRATDPDAGDVLKVTLDPAGIYAATSCSNKVVRLYDFFSGECLTRLPGHSELITGVKFTRDCSRMISVAGDGCIFVWKLSAEFTKNIKARLAEQNLGRPDGKQNPAPPNLSPIGHLQVDETQDETQDESFFGPNTLNNSVLPRFKFSEADLPAWAKDGENSNKAAGATPSQQPRGKWAQNADKAIIVYSEIDDDGIPITQFDRSDKRRFTMVANNSGMWGQPVTPQANKKPHEEDGTFAVDMENTGGHEPRLSKHPFSAEEDDVVMLDDDDVMRETVGNMEDDDTDNDEEHDDSNEKEQDTHVVYFDQEQQLSSAFRVEDKPVTKQSENKGEGINDEEGDSDDKGAQLKESTGSTTNANNLAGADSDDFEGPSPLLSAFANHDAQHSTHNALRTSFSQKFHSGIHPASAMNNQEGLKPKKSKESLVKDIEKTREFLAKLDQKTSATRNSSGSEHSNPPLSPSTQPSELSNFPLPSSPQLKESPKLIATSPTTSTAPTSAFPPSPTSPSSTQLSGNIQTYAEDAMSTISRSDFLPPATLPRPLSEYEESLKTLSSAFRTSLALFQEVNEAPADPITTHVRSEFSSLFDQLQSQLGVVSASTQTLPQRTNTQYRTTGDNLQTTGDNLEKYSDLIIDRVLQKLGSLEFSSKLLHTIQASQTMRPGPTLDQ